MARARKPIDARSRGLTPEIKSILLISVVGVLAVAWWMGRNKDADGAQADGGEGASAAVVAYTLGQPSHGSDEAPAVLVKFTDFQ